MNKNPYYIVAPRFTYTSAGVRVLYKLCDLINKLGYESYIYQRPHLSFSKNLNGYSLKFLTASIRNLHYKKKLTPIVIYPETIDITKFNPPFRVRYFLNYKNLLATNLSKKRDNFILTYSQNILDKLKMTTPSQSIFIPVSDYLFFKPNINKERKGCVYYAGKYKYHFNGKTFSITDGMIEITRDEIRSQSREEIKHLFQSSELFYCYEDSALAIEAMLCGCPVVFLPNKHFKECLASKELKGIGYAWGNDKHQIKHAKQTINLFRKRYIFLVKKTENQVKIFINKTQTLVKEKKYSSPFGEGYIEKYNFLGGRFVILRFIMEYIEDNGILKIIKTIYKRISYKRFKI